MRTFSNGLAHYSSCLKTSARFWIGSRIGVNALEVSPYAHPTLTLRSPSGQPVAVYVVPLHCRLLANILLDELDHELGKRGQPFVQVVSLRLAVTPTAQKGANGNKWRIGTAVRQSTSSPTKSFLLSQRQTRMAGGVWDGRSNLPSTRFSLKRGSKSGRNKKLSLRP